MRAILGHSDQVAKVYARAPDAKQGQKLRTMADSTDPGLLKIAAWPSDLLLGRQGLVQGFVMPRAKSAENVHELYSPKSRADAFPTADFRFLVHVGANIARAFATVHERGHIVGDVNHGNVLVGSDGTVMLIDCDSFQVRNGSNLFTCDVGSPLFTAPELHGRPFRGLVRTVNHDRFGLAVLLFYLLYMGRHPYAGRYSGSGEMSPERFIAENLFAYGANRRMFGMERPPGTISLEAMGPAIAAQFELAFAPPANGRHRPHAISWANGLTALEASLRVCPAASWHHYPAALSSCPWCAVESQTGARLFGHRISVGTAAEALDLKALLEAIEAVPAPGPDQALPSERPWSPPPGTKLPSSFAKDARRALSLIVTAAGLYAWMARVHHGGVFLGILAGILAFTIWPMFSPQERAAADRAVAAARAEWESTLRRWRSEATRERFEQRKTNLKRACSELDGIPRERQRRVAQLEGEREKRQRQRYLDRFRIDRASIPGIGPGRTAMLASYGVETAADVTRSNILQIPGFGEKRTGDLVHWRQMHESGFRFNAGEPVDKRDIDALDRELETKRQKLLATVAQGPTSLQGMAREVQAARIRLMPILERSWSELRVEEARRKAH